jgi:hypothetical protein
MMMQNKLRGVTKAWTRRVDSWERRHLPAQPGCGEGLLGERGIDTTQGAAQASQRGSWNPMTVVTVRGDSAGRRHRRFAGGVPSSGMIMHHP